MLRRSLPPAAAAEKEAAMYFIGIDLGTSACKLLLVDEAGAIVNEVTHEYPLGAGARGLVERSCDRCSRAAARV